MKYLESTNISRYDIRKTHQHSGQTWGAGSLVYREFYSGYQELLADEPRGELGRDIYASGNRRNFKIVEYTWYIPDI